MERVVTGLMELDKKRYQVYLDEEFAFVLYKGEVRKYKIVVGKPLAQAAYQELVQEVLPKRAKLRAMNLLTKRPYTEKKLRQTRIADRAGNTTSAEISSDPTRFIARTITTAIRTAMRK